MQWHIQDDNITTKIEFEVDFALSALIATNFVTWKFHVDEFAKGRYDIMVGQYLLI